MTIQQDFQQRPHISRLFNAVGQVGPDSLVSNLTGTLRVVVENVGGSNELLVKGRLEGQADWVTLETITGPTSGQTVDISVVDEISFECTVYDPSGGTPNLVASGFFKQATGGGGGGSINDGANVGTGGIGVYDSAVGDTLNFRKLRSIAPELTIVHDGGTNTVTFDIDLSGIDIGDLGGVTSFDPNTIVGVDNAGDVGSIPGWALDTNSGGYNIQLSDEPDGETGGPFVHAMGFNIDPISNSPDLSWQLNYHQVNIDTNNDGFSFGTNGAAVRFNLNNLIHNGSSDIGSVEFIQNNFSLGNGTDPIDVRNIAYVFGFGTVNANVNLSGGVQGYGFQPNVNALATIDPSTNWQAFYDFTNIACVGTSYTTFAASPIIAELPNNRNYNGLSINPNIPIFSGTASIFGVTVNGVYGTFGTGQFYGVNVNPTITLNKTAYGIFVSMDNVTNYAGVAASLVIQDLTIAADQPSSDGNTVTIAYTAGGTAGSEVVSNVGLAFSVQIEDGVSTATQIETALNAYFQFTSILNVTVSGVGSNPQNIQAPTNLAGGENPGQKKAAYLDGDVEITGALTFGGALSIGKLSAFASQAVIDGGGNPQSVHSLVSNPTVGNSVTIANADTFGINTAALMTVGSGSTVTSGALGIGLAALALPAVVQIGAGSTVDFVTASVFAISLDGSAGAGSNIDNVNLCRSIAIPNGITSIGILKGFLFDLPFGDPGTVTYGVYIEPDTAHNFMAGDLVIGDADLPTNASVGLEVNSTEKALLVSRMTTTEKNALTAVNGMIVYDTTLNKFQGYENGAWANLI